MLKSNDTDAPYVIDASSVPNSLSAKYPKNSKLLYYFSEEMYADNIKKKGISLLNSNNTAIDIIVDYASKSSGSFALVTPSVTLADGTYTLNILEEARDLSGNKLNPIYKISFQTSDNDMEKPIIVSRTPMPNSMVPINNRKIIIQFNEVLDPFYSKPELKLASSSDSINGVIDVVDDSYIFTYERDLTINEIYTVTLMGTVQDLAGNSDNLIESYPVYTFTASESDAIPPKLTGEPSVEVTSTEVYIKYSTDEYATSNIRYGKSTANNAYPIPEDQTSDEMEHYIALSGLTSSTTYKYKIIAKDLSGNEFTSSEYSFKTLDAGTTPTTPENKWDAMKWDQGKWQ